jgi:peptidoglycan DL-endopeptidase LytF
MNRRDTILIAVLINAGLLVILFATAMHGGGETPQEASSSNTPVVAMAPAETTPLALTPVVSSTSQLQSQPIVIGDEVDQVLRQYEKGAVVAQATEYSGGKNATSTNKNTPVEQSETTKEFSEGIVSMAPVIAQTAPFQAQRNQENSSGQNQGQQGEFVQVTVKRGDILERIARSNGTTVDEIMRANHLPNTKLKIGQVLKVPVSKTVVKRAPIKTNVAAKPPVGSAEQGGVRYYTIKSGDNPWAIANKFRMPLEEFLKLNNLNEERARKLKPGDKVRVR